jgi:uncharacterized protein YrrD
MLLLSKSLLNQPIMSLRTNGPVGETLSAIFNPNNLKIEGFYCQDRFEKKQLILPTSEIRDIIPQGMIVNDHDALTEVDELIRLQDILKLNFELIGKTVYTTGKERIGKVTDFAADSQTLYVQKLYVGQSLLKSFGSGQLSIDRTHIIEITNRKIVIQDILKPKKSVLPAISPAIS